MKNFLFQRRGGGILVLLSVFFVSCSVVTDKNIPSSYMPAPYASAEELDAVTNLGSEYAFWKVSRVFALMNMEIFAPEYGWEDATLSERAVLIYDGESKPKYYEFRVVADGKDVGAISAVAQKKDGGPVAYVTTTPKDYSKIVSAVSPLKIIANGYSYAIAPLSEPGEEIIAAYDPNTGGLTNVLVDIGFTEFMSNLTPEIRSNLGFTNESQIQEGIQAEAQIQAENAQMWTEIDDHQSNLLSVSDDIIQNPEDYTNDPTVYDTNSAPPVILNSFTKDKLVSSSWYVSKFNTPLMKSLKNPYGTNVFAYYQGVRTEYGFWYWYWCGECALSRVKIGLYGLGSQSNEQWFNDYNTLKVATGSASSGGISWPWNLGGALRSVTANQYGVQGFKFHWWDTAKNWITSQNLPLLSLRSGKYNGSKDNKKAWHYRVVYGVTDYTYYKWNRFLFFSWISEWHLYIYQMQDNGADGGNFVEGKNQQFQFALYPITH